MRIVWGLGHGDPWVPIAGASYLGLHLEPALLVFAALGRIVPIAPLLLISQAVVVALAPLPVYRLARRRLATLPHGERLAVLLALLPLLYPTVSVATLFDFHPGTLAISPILFALDALDEGPAASRRLVVWLLVALSLREDVALAIAALGVTLAVRPRGEAVVRERDRRLGALFVAGGLAWFFGYTLLVQPRFLPAHGSYEVHFGALGHSAGAILEHALAHPLALARYLVSEDRPGYALTLLWPVAFLPLLAPRELAAALPLAAINLLSSFPRVRTLEAHYTMVLVPFLVASSVRGAARAAELLRRQTRRWPSLASLEAALPTLALLVAATTAQILHGDSPVARGWDGARFRSDGYARTARAIVAQIPASASVRAPRRMVAHLAERPEIRSLEESPPAPAELVIGEEGGRPVLLR